MLLYLGIRAAGFGAHLHPALDLPSPGTNNFWLAPMDHSQQILAVVRASRPSFRNSSEKADRVAYALHAYFLTAGYKLVATGRAANDLKEVDASAAEVGTEGWLDLEAAYSFAYLDTTGRQAGGVEVKAVAMDDKLVVHLHRKDSLGPPATIELDVDTIATESPSPVEGYKDVKGMVGKIDAAMQQGTSGSKPPTAKAITSSNTTAEDPLSAGPNRGGSRDRGYDDRDRLPGGMGGIPGMGSFDEPGFNPGVPGGIGGMHVGPHDPIFAGRRGGPGLPGGLTPGLRYDPTNPQGLEGFHPEDFQRGRRTHPDIQPPGGGRGTDFDSMFG